MGSNTIQALVLFCLPLGYVLSVSPSSHAPFHPFNPSSSLSFLPPSLLPLSIPTPLLPCPIIRPIPLSTLSPPVHPGPPAPPPPPLHPLSPPSHPPPTPLPWAAGAGFLGTTAGDGAVSRGRVPPLRRLQDHRPGGDPPETRLHRVLHHLSAAAHHPGGHRLLAAEPPLRLPGSARSFTAMVVVKDNNPKNILDFILLSVL